MTSGSILLFLKLHRFHTVIDKAFLFPRMWPLCCQMLKEKPCYFLKQSLGWPLFIHVHGPLNSYLSQAGLCYGDLEVSLNPDCSPVPSSAPDPHGETVPGYICISSFPPKFQSAEHTGYHCLVKAFPRGFSAFTVSPADPHLGQKQNPYPSLG